MDTHLKTSKAAKFIGVAAPTLRYWRAIGYGPAYSVNSPRCIVYAEAELIKWLADRRCVPSVRATLKEFHANL
jgi:DNA-binding transcriptional MerR regulator